MAAKSRPTGITFTAVLPQDSAMPVKPTRDSTVEAGVLRRRVRIWLDGWMEPGDTERLLLLAESRLRVSIEAEPQD